jgi:release factor glutamine methyltransferase
MTVIVREEPAALNDLLNIDDALVRATERLRDISESPRLDAELLLALALDVARSYLFAHPEDRLDPAAAERFFANVDKRVAGMPLAYITGEKEFWSLNLAVSPNTLVPRPETEVLVEQALALIPKDAAWHVLDLGTGSGAIALAIARERQLCLVVATDVSQGALAVARENARRLSIANIEFVCGRWCEPLQGTAFDVIVSNPPYVEADDPHLHALRHEPLDALAAGPDGLDAIRAISRRAGNLLKAGGRLLIEHGAAQADAVASILASDGWTVRRCVADLAGLPRVTVAQR